MAQKPWGGHPPSCDPAPLTTSLRGLWVSGNAGTGQWLLRAKGRRPKNRPSDTRGGDPKTDLRKEELTKQLGREGRGPKDPGVVAPLAPAGCRGNHLLNASCVALLDRPVEGHGLLLIFYDAPVVLFQSALSTRNMGNVLAYKLVSLLLMFFLFPEDAVLHVVPTTSARSGLSRSLRHPVGKNSGNVSEKNITQEEHTMSLRIALILRSGPIFLPAARSSLLLVSCQLASTRFHRQYRLAQSMDVSVYSAMFGSHLYMLCCHSTEISRTWASSFNDPLYFVVVLYRRSSHSWLQAVISPERAVQDNRVTLRLRRTSLSS